MFKIKENEMKYCQLTDDDEACGLEKLLVVPGGMLCFQDVTHSIVFPQPQCGEHSQTREESEYFLTNSNLALGRDARGVVHLDGHVGYSR